MISHRSVFALVTLSTALSWTQFAYAQTRPPVAPQSAASISSAPEKAPALTRELIDLIQEHKLLELRTIYNGPFAASLFFNPDSLEYYVALLKHNEFWWISKTTNSQDAESLYSKMATQTIQLAAPTLEKLQLDAKIAVTQKKLQQAQQKQAELAEQLSAQSRIVREGTAAQSQLQSQALQLAAERDALQRQLATINSSIQGLQSAAGRGPDIAVSFPHAESGGAALPQDQSPTRATGRKEIERTKRHYAPAHP